MIASGLALAPWLVLLLASWPAMRAVRAGWIDRPGTILVAAAAWLLVTQGTSLLGPYAPLEWGDGDRLFQGYFPYLADRADARYLPELMGGVDRYAAGRIGGEYWSLRLVLLQAMPLWLVTMLFRLAVPAVAMAGIFLCCHRLIGAPRSVSLAIAALFAVGYDFTATLTFLYGISLAGIPLLHYALFSAQWPLLAVVGIFYIGTADPIYWLPLLWITSLGLRLWIRPRSDLGAAIALVVFSIVWVANYADTLLGFAALLPWSVRSAGDGPGLAGLLAIQLRWLFEPTLRFNHGGMLTLAPLAFAAATAVIHRDRRTAIATATTLAIGLAPPFLGAIPWSQLGLTALSTYRWYWEYGAFALALMCAASAAATWAQAGRSSAVHWTAGVTMAMALAMLGVFKAQTTLLGLTRGNMSSLTAVPNLVDRQWAPQDGSLGRVVGLPSKIDPNSLVGYGLATLDGGSTLIHRDLHLFWSAGVMRARPGPTREMLGFGLHPAFDACCAPLRIDEIADVDLLRLAGVGHLVSYRALESRHLTQVSGPDVQSKLATRQALMGPPPPAFVYRLEAPLPLAYPARAVVAVADPSDRTAVVELVRRHALGGAAILAGSDIAALRGGPIAARGRATGAWRGETLTIETHDWDGGLLLVNVAYLPWWRATTGAGDELPVRPANLVQMAIDVPAGTTAVRLDYRRPLVRDRLADSLFPRR